MSNATEDMNRLIIMLLFGIVLLSFVAYFGVIKQGGANPGNQSSALGKQPSTSPTTALVTTSASKPSVYYIITPTALGNMLNQNYSVSSSYSILLYSDSFPGSGSSSSGTLFFSNGQKSRNQTIAVLYAQPGNVTINLSLQPFVLRTGGYIHNVTAESSYQNTSKQNLQVYSHNSNYSITMQLNYTGARNLTYYFNGQNGVVICLRPSITSIAGSYFVVLTGFNVSTQGTSQC